jgi:iron complex transport system substrate-binding protein
MRLIHILLWFVVAASAQPQRIVSTAPSVTETLFAIGAGDRVVGVSTYCRYPEQATSLPKIGSYRQPSAELIASLRPDLVILNESVSELSNRLDALRIPYVQVATGSMATAFHAMRVVGDAVGNRKQADALIARIEATVRQAKAQAGKHPSRALIIVGRDVDSLTGLIAAGPSSYLGELLEAAGGRNALVGSSLPAYPQISLETVMRLDPDVIFDAGEMGDRTLQDGVQRQRVLQVWQTRADLRAVRSNRVVPVFSEAFTLPGPRMLDVLQFLSDSLQGKTGSLQGKTGSLQGRTP